MVDASRYTPSEARLISHPSRWLHHSIAALLLAAAIAALAPAAASAAAAPAPPGIELRLETGTIVADEDFLWPLRFVIVNHAASGLYSDSLLCEIESLDPGLPESARHSLVRLTGAVRLAATVGAEDSGHFELRMPPAAERAHLTFRYFGHRSDRTQVSSTLLASAEPGPVSQRMPSEFVTVNGQKIEYVRISAPGDTLAPALLYIVGDDQTARSVLRNSQPLATHGIHVVTMSLPGHGLSEGKDDAAGPAAVAAASRVLDEVRRMKGVDQARIAVWGVQRGATVAALVAAQRSDVRALILEAGCYDPWACARNADAGSRAGFLAAAGSDSVAWRARAPIAVASHLHVATLVLHGDQDRVAPEAQACGFVAALVAGGTDAREQRFASLGHDLHPASARPATEFLIRQFRPSK